ncbi:ATPase family associated with various cellular activities (AAA) [Methylobacterium phyllostachyos]|uniref:ATPase family associated with various cellular activities (AAA) n=1 Tax=Methylobacterium phyllostachyos TaxID=582672 RepID=A0A1G9RW12_9HYPH|nr:AAA family ATPase [Methylobacterium phyllostachyos]SDM27210.1 ATPase family associated with various cellular activities (AAA) [Methylobacterium phyllostachyos]
MTDRVPAFGVPPTLRELLCGAAPYGGSAHRDLLCYLAYTWSSLIIQDQRTLCEDVGASMPMVFLIEGLWKSCMRLRDRKADAWEPDYEIFQQSLTAFWLDLGRLLYKRPAEDFEVDWHAGVSNPLDDLHGRVTLHLAMLGDPVAIDAMPDLLWMYARRAQPGEGYVELHAAAIGCELDDGSYRRQWTRGYDGLVDILSQWRERGMEPIANAAALARGQIRDAVVEAMQPRPKPMTVLAALRKEAAEAEQVPPEPEGPGLVVLASVGHLPGNVKDGEAKNSSSQTPRIEFAPIAGRRLPLVPVPDLARVQRVLAGEFPDAAGIVASILAPVAGRPYVRLPRILLRGGPGTGKSRLARRLGEELGLDVTVYGCASVSDGSVIGTSRMWGTGRASVPLQAIKRAGAASVLVVLDEISRAGTRADNGRLTDGILALAEPETARAYHDPYLECAVDLSAVSYIATANSTDGLDPALLSRFRAVDMPAPTLASLPVLARGLVAELRRERGLDARWLPDLTPEELDLVGEHWRGGSVRTLQALVECALDGRHAGPAN